MWPFIVGASVGTLMFNLPLAVVTDNWWGFWASVVLILVLSGVELIRTDLKHS